MNGWIFIAITAVAASSFAQQPVTQAAQASQAAQATPASRVYAQDRMAEAQAELARAEKELEKATIGDATRTYIAGTISNAIAGAVGAMANTGLAFQSRGGNSRLDARYDEGTRLLDDHRYEDAVKRFNEVIDGKTPRADGALYWKAYALNRIGRKDDALAAIAALRRDYAGSHWLNDAQALEAEVKQSSGQAVPPSQETNEDLKLMAINSLMSADPDRAIPLLEGILKGNSAPKVKDRALFVLTQNRSARAQQILAEYAKGAGNPDLQVRAIRYIGMSGTNNAAQQLAGYYTASTDAAVKRQIIQSLMMSRGKDALFNLAKTEKDDGLRGEVIRQLGVMQATDQLSQLYASETSADNKIQIVRSMFIAGASDKLLDLVKNEKDMRVRDEAIRNYARTRAATPEALASLYAADSDPRAKREVVNGLFERGDGKLLVDLARKESDPGMKSYIVRRLGNMPRNKEATDYMIELLK